MKKRQSVPKGQNRHRLSSSDVGDRDCQIATPSEDGEQPIFGPWIILASRDSPKVHRSLGRKCLDLFAQMILRPHCLLLPCPQLVRLG